jgi:hypothetical protein
MSEPLVGITIHDSPRVRFPHDVLSGELQIDAVAADEIESLEVSVLWYTEGKGDEDLGVHFFKRYTADGGRRGALQELKTYSTALPASPLSYDGQIVKIRWCVRVRVFLTRGREAMAEQPFQLGNVPNPAPPPAVASMAV